MSVSQERLHAAFSSLADIIRDLSCSGQGCTEISGTAEHMTNAQRFLTPKHYGIRGFIGEQKAQDYVNLDEQVNVYTDQMRQFATCRTSGNPFPTNIAFDFPPGSTITAQNFISKNHQNIISNYTNNRTLDFVPFAYHVIYGDKNEHVVRYSKIKDSTDPDVLLKSKRDIILKMHETLLNKYYTQKSDNQASVCQQIPSATLLPPIINPEYVEQVQKSQGKK